MHPENMLMKEVCHKRLHEISRRDKSVEAGSRVVAARSWWGDEEQRMTANEYKVSFWGNEHILKIDCGNGCTTL